MNSKNRRAGTIYFKRNGILQEATGSFTIGYGKPKREGMMHSSGVAGYKETPQIPYIEGEIFDRGDLDLEEFFTADNDTYTLEEANGKTAVLRNAWYAGDGTVSTEEAKVQVRFEGFSLEEVMA